MVPLRRTYLNSLSSRNDTSDGDGFGVVGDFLALRSSELDGLFYGAALFGIADFAMSALRVLWGVGFRFLEDCGYELLGGHDEFIVRGFHCLC